MMTGMTVLVELITRKKNIRIRRVSEYSDEDYEDEEADIELESKFDNASL